MHGEDGIVAVTLVDQEQRAGAGVAAVQMVPMEEEDVEVAPPRTQHLIIKHRL